MPYKAKGKCVYKKKRDGSLGEKVGCTDGPVKDYLAALYANTDESLEKTIRDCIEEAVDPSYNQREYATIVTVNIDRKLGGEREETLREIRGIRRVTTVSTLPDSAKSYDTRHRVDLNVKFALQGAESLQKYLQIELYPGLRKIKGLSIINVSNPKDI
jgi:hypothetical protein